MSELAAGAGGDENERGQIRRARADWAYDVPLEVLLDPHRSLVRTMLRYLESVDSSEATVTVLIPEIIPSKRRHEILHNQRGRLLESVLKTRTGRLIIATLPFHVHD